LEGGRGDARVKENFGTLDMLMPAEKVKKAS